jgi:hypothetical protein
MTNNSQEQVTTLERTLGLGSRIDRAEITFSESFSPVTMAAVDVVDTFTILTGTISIMRANSDRGIEPF